MDDTVDPRQCLVRCIRVTHVPNDELHVVGEVGANTCMHLLFDRIEHDDVVAQVEQSSDDV